MIVVPNHPRNSPSYYFAGGPPPTSNPCVRAVDEGEVELRKLSWWSRRVIDHQLVSSAQPSHTL